MLSPDADITFGCLLIILDIIVNPPDACILAIGGIKQVPVVKNGEIVPGNIMKVTLSCDHRVVDGALGSAFLNSFKNYLENPVLLLGKEAI